jgi:hypothetical protein
MHEKRNGKHKGGFVMCNFWSAIVTKDGDVFYDELTDRHEKIIEDHKLLDDTNDRMKRQFVRIEISPSDGDVFSLVDGWNFKIDEGEVPVWWKAGLEKAARAVCKDYIAKVAHQNKDGLKIQAARGYLKNCKQVTAYGSSQVTAYGSSQVTAYNSSQVKAYGSSQVTAYGSSQVKELKDNAIIIDKKSNIPIIIIANSLIKIKKFRKVKKEA